MKKIFEMVDFEDPHKYRAIFEDEVDGEKIYFVGEKDEDFGFGYGSIQMEYAFSVPDLMDNYLDEALEHGFGIGDLMFFRQVAEKYKEEFDKMEFPDRNDLTAKIDYAYKTLLLGFEREEYYEKNNKIRLMTCPDCKATGTIAKRYSDIEMASDNAGSLTGYLECSKCGYRTELP